VFATAAGGRLDERNQRRDRRWSYTATTNRRHWSRRSQVQILAHAFTAVRTCGPRREAWSSSSTHPPYYRVPPIRRR